MTWILTAVPVSANESSPLHKFDVPELTVDAAINAVALQAGASAIFPHADARGLRANRLQGEYTLEEALKRVLDGTGLDAHVTVEGVITLSISQQETRSLEKNMNVNKNKTRGILGVILAAFAGLANQPAFAQTQTEEGADVSAFIEEIIVTARKRSENIQDVPVSVTAYTAADIEAKSITSLKQLAQFTPNFNMYNSGNDGSTTSEVSIRGISNSIGGPGVGIYLDGVYLSRQQGIDLDLMDAERLEVLRGPQGTLFGKNTIGGAVNLVTVRPTDEFSGNAEVTYGEFDRIDGKVLLNIPLIPGKLRSKIALSTQNRDGFGKLIDINTGAKLGEMGDRERLSGRIILDWEMTDNFNVLVSLDGLRAREHSTTRTLAARTNSFLDDALNFIFMLDPPIGPALLPPDVYTSFGAGNNYQDVDSYGTAVTIGWDLGDTAIGNVALKSITSYRDLEVGFSHDFDFSPYPATIASNFAFHDQISQEFQVSGVSFNERLTWVAGAYYFKEETDEPSTANVYPQLVALGIIPEFSFNLLYGFDNRSWAVFAQGTYQITDKLSITGGIRYTDEEKRALESQARLSDGAFTGPFCFNCAPPTSGTTSYSEISGRGGLEYRWNEDLMLYFSAAHGFKSGGLTQSVTDVTQITDLQLNPYLPEFVWTYEVGLRSTWLDGRLRVNATGFFSDYTDIQYSFAFAPPGTTLPQTFVSNGPAAEIKGFELDTLFMPVEGLTLSASVGLTDAEYTKFDPRDTILTSASKFPFTPEWAYTLAGQYSIPTGLGELTGRLDYSWNDNVIFDVRDSLNPLTRQDSYGILNARLSLAHAAGWTVSVFGTNLTDEIYLLSAIDLGGSVIHQPAPPREWGVSIKYDF